MKLEAYVRSDLGMVRTENEDNFNICGVINETVNSGFGEANYEGEATQGVFAVADGMGGIDNGELASFMVVRELSACSMNDFENAVRCNYQTINTDIRRYIHVNNIKRMGSTLVALYIEGNAVRICNVGDSRAYIYENGKLSLASKIHSTVHRMYELGILTKEQFDTHPGRHSIDQFFGMNEDDVQMSPYISEEMKITDNSVYMLCSDGLTDIIDDTFIEGVLSKDISAYDMVNELVNEALINGASDNTTVLVVKAYGRN